jgi:tripartite ATP-independent transporter DctP family solute receptor
VKDVEAKVSRRAFAAGSGAALATIGIVRSPAQADPTIFKVSYPVPATHPQHLRMVDAAARIASGSAGRLQLQLFPNGILGGDDASVSQLRSGAIQMYVGSSGIMSTVVPDAAIEDVGFAFHTQQSALAAMDGPLGDLVRKQLLDRGIYAFGKCWVNGFRQIATSSRPIKGVEDVAGLKIRTPPARLYVDMFKTLGAAPTTINPSETYVALQTKIVDSVEVPLAIIESSRWYEPTKYLSITNHIWGNLYPVVNLEAYKALPSDLQTLLNREIDRAGMQQRDDMLSLDALLRKKLGEQGLTVNEVVDKAPFQAKLRPFYADMKRTFSGEAWALLEKHTGSLT